MVWWHPGSNAPRGRRPHQLCPFCIIIPYRMTNATLCGTRTHGYTAYRISSSVAMRAETWTWSNSHPWDAAATCGTTAVSTPPADEPDTNWLVMCGTNDPSTQAPSNVIYEQNEIGTRNGGTGSCALHVNKYRALASPFALHSVLIWDKGLSPEQMKTVTRELQGQIQGTLQTDYEGVVSDPGLQQLLAQHPAHAVSPGPLSLRNELDTGR